MTKNRIEVVVRFLDEHYCRVRFFRFGKLGRRVVDWWLGPCSPDQEHPTVFVESLGADIDTQVAPLVERLNSLGFETISSCQGNPGVAFDGEGQLGFVMFSHEDRKVITEFVIETLGEALASLIPDSVSLVVKRGRSKGIAEMWFTNEALGEVTERVSDCAKLT